ncbi:MAG: hypothetical protein EHM39_12625, partial [Chloroflexi bacterium]
MERRRNRGNEVIVALVVIGTLAVALTFGIILTLSSHANEPTDSDRTRTAIARANNETTEAITVEARLTQGSTEEVAALPSPAVTEEAQPAATGTPQPSDTAAPEPTDRPVVVAGTEEAPTDEPQPTETPTEKPTERPTQRPTLSIASLTPTERPTLTATPRPSDTPRPTLTDTPTRTPTRQPSNTPRPTQTFTPTPTEIKATLTFTPYPTLTPSITPFGGERTNTPVPSGCTVPQGWIGYTIQPGDTL